MISNIIPRIPLINPKPLNIILFLAIEPLIHQAAGAAGKVYGVDIEGAVEVYAAEAFGAEVVNAPAGEAGAVAHVNAGAEGRVVVADGAYCVDGAGDGGGDKGEEREKYSFWLHDAFVFVVVLIIDESKVGNSGRRKIFGYGLDNVKIKR
jgi:hypothetical protein